MDESDSEKEEDGDDDSKGPDFNYILAMQLWSLSKERKDALLKLRDDKAEELRLLRRKSPSDLWKDDLDKFKAELDVSWCLIDIFWSFSNLFKIIIF